MSVTNDKWLIAVPNTAAASAGKGGSPSILGELTQAASGLATIHPFHIPTLKVGTLDSLMTIRSDKQTRTDGQDGTPRAGMHVRAGGECVLPHC